MLHKYIIDIAQNLFKVPLERVITVKNKRNLLALGACLPSERHGY